MCKKLVITLIALFIGQFVFAQDIITTKKGEDIKVKILEVTQTELKYRLFNEPDGPLYSMRKTDILIVRYASGRNEVFNQNTTTTPSSSTNNNYNNYNSNYSNSNYSNQDNNGLRYGMSYSELKYIYDKNAYRSSYDDRYSPFWLGVSSFFITGLGECIAGEWGRGLGKFGTTLLLNSISTVFLANEVYAGSLIFSLGTLGVGIWSIIDASNIAKVKNMYYRDLKASYSFDIHPTFDYINTPNGGQNVIGLGLAINF